MNAAKKTLKDFHAIGTLKCDLLDHIVEDTSRLQNSAYSSVDQFDSSHKPKKHNYERSSKRIGRAERKTIAQY